MVYCQEMASRQLPRTVSSDASAVTETVDSSDRPWLHGSLNLNIKSEDLTDAFQEDGQKRDKVIKGILKAFHHKSTKNPDPEVYDIIPGEDKVSVVLVFKSKSVASEFLTGHFRDCKPKRALNACTGMNVLCCTLYKEGTELKTTDPPSIGIEQLLTLIGMGAIPQKGGILTDLSDSMAKLDLQQTWPKEDVRDYEHFRGQQVSRKQHILFSTLIGGNNWKRIAQRLHLSGCRFLTDAAIDSIDVENRDAEEKSYQMIRKFIESEGRNATLDKLVKAMDDSGLKQQATDLILED
ncbi:uncharacterized protein LOC144437725 [Glandiceps talaboti]